MAADQIRYVVLSTVAVLVAAVIWHVWGDGPHWLLVVEGVCYLVLAFTGFGYRKAKKGPASVDRAAP